MIQYLKNQVREIEESPSLWLYGVFLAATHVWTFRYWNKGDFFVTAQSSINSEPICFPWFPDCDLFRASISVETWQWILYLYGALGLLTAVFFINKKLVRLAWVCFAILTFAKLFLHLSNYNFMGNYHYMVHIISFCFLFFPHKNIVPKYLLVGFYVAAGFLKLNIDWLSGAAMISTPYITGHFFVFSLYYVIFLELIFVFGLLHRHPWIRWMTLVQLLIFHGFSWHIVGFFYPMVMFSLLSIFFIDEFRYLFKNVKTPDLLTSFVQFKQSRSIYLLIGLFCILQFTPLLMVADPSLSGVARLGSLNMFDSKTECHSALTAQTQRGAIHIAPPVKNMGVRLRCDPLVFLNQAHQLCRKNQKSQEIQKLSLHLFTKRVTALDFKQVLAIDNVCELKNPLWGELNGGQG